MSTAAIVGAGQGGLHLAFGLLEQGHQVTVFTDRDADELAAQGAMASHTLQTPALDLERASGSCASDLLPQNWGSGVDFALSLDGRSVVSAWRGDWEAPSAAVDLRLKYPLLLGQLVQAGGNVVVANVSADRLDQLASDHDVVFVATGKGGLAELFPIDESRTTFDEPQRCVTQLHVLGIPPCDPSPAGERLYFRFLPMHGEIFMGPMLHLSGRPAHNLLIEAHPGGEFDRFGSVSSAAEALEIVREIVREHLPWEPALQDIELADERAFLKGAIRPVVRAPVAHLPGGRAAYAVGDVAMTHDPVAGQGGNCTAAYVAHLLETVQSADGTGMSAGLVQDRFADFWHSSGQWFVGLSAAMVRPVTPAMQQILGAAQASRTVADRVASAFAYPDRLVPFLATEEGAGEFIARAESGAPATAF